MRTKAILVLTLSMLILLIPASSDDNQTHHSYITLTSPLPDNMIVEYALDLKINSTSGWTAMTTKEQLTVQNDTTPASPSSTSSPASRSTNTPTGTDSSKTKNSKLILFVILLAIIVLMLFLGGLHAMSKQETWQDSLVPRFLMGVRKRLRATIGNLEVRMGLRLWPGGKRGGEDDDEEADGRQGEEGGHRTDYRGEGGSCGAKNEEKGERKEEDSDYSNDYSSMEGDNLKERVLRREEEESKQIGNYDGEVTSSACEGGQSAVEEETSGDKKAGSEEIALVNSLQEEDEKVDLCDVTVL